MYLSLYYSKVLFVKISRRECVECGSLCIYINLIYLKIGFLLQCPFIVYKCLLSCIEVVYYRYFFCPLYSLIYLVLLSLYHYFIIILIILLMLLLFPANTLYSKYDKSRHVPQRTLIKLQNLILHKTMLGIYVKSFKYLDKVTVFTIQIARTFICIFFFFCQKATRLC